MRTIANLMLATLMLALGGCAAPAVFNNAIGGSKADGTVDMSFIMGTLGKPVIDWEASEYNARRVCVNWGYSGAQYMGGHKEGINCSVRSSSNAYGGFSSREICSAYRYIATYQCTGRNP